MIVPINVLKRILKVCLLIFLRLIMFMNKSLKFLLVTIIILIKIYFDNKDIEEISSIIEIKHFGCNILFVLIKKRN